MTWKSVGQTVAKVAPILGGVLGGPVGAIATAAGSLIASAIGEDADPEAVAKALKKNPEALLKLKELEAAERARLLEWREAQLKAGLDNLTDARAREVKLAQAGHGSAWATSVVAVIVTVGFFIMLRGVLLQSEVSEAALLLLGSLGSAFGAVVNYYLGSSLGSKRKDEILGRPS